MDAVRQAGLRRLRDFLPRAGRAYASSRNADTGPGGRDNVSMLSPYLRHRLVHEREVVGAVLERHSRQAAEKFIQEVFWRTYFKGWLEQRPGVWQQYRADLAGLSERLAADTELRQRYDAAVAGRTGIDCVDAWVAELVETGYLHNHTRMWFASIWVYTLGLPWQLGADLFLRHLLDGDAASNTLSWRWVCGLHTRGKTYLARPDNIDRYTGGRFRPTGLAREAPPLRENLDHPVVPLTTVGPVADEPFLLVVTEDDCLPETLTLPRPPVAVVGLESVDERSPEPTGDLAAEFARRAVGDALERAGHRFRCATTAGGADNWGAAIVKQARASGVASVVVAGPPVGPTADRLDAACPELQRAGVTLHRLRRAWDAAAWPHARRGFFQLRKQIPRLLDESERRAATQLSLGLSAPEIL